MKIGHCTTAVVALLITLAVAMSCAPRGVSSLESDLSHMLVSGDYTNTASLFSEELLAGRDVTLADELAARTFEHMKGDAIRRSRVTRNENNYFIHYTFESGQEAEFFVEEVNSRFQIVHFQ